VASFTVFSACSSALVAVSLSSSAFCRGGRVRGRLHCVSGCLGQRASSFLSSAAFFAASRAACRFGFLGHLCCDFFGCSLGFGPSSGPGPSLPLFRRRDGVLATVTALASVSSVNSATIF
jgi:hypothetical protein